MTTPMDYMIGMSRGAQRGQALAEDSPLEAPVGGHNRHSSLMSPATREMVLKSRTQEIEAFAESRQLNAGAVLGIAEAAMRLGRVPDLRQYGFSGDDAKAIKHFIAGDVLNIAIEQMEAMETINEAVSDKLVAETVKTLSVSGASRLLKKVSAEDKKLSGYTDALKALKEGKLQVVRGLMSEGTTAIGASKALVAAMNGASAKVKEAVQAEATSAAQVASFMKLNDQMAMYRPSPVLTTAVQDEADADAQAERQLPIGPHLGINPFSKQANTIEDMARMANIAQQESADDIENPTAVAPKGEKVKKASAKKLRSAGEYEKGQFHPGSHGTAEDQDADDVKVVEGWGHNMRQAASKKVSPEKRDLIRKKLDDKQGRFFDRAGKGVRAGQANTAAHQAKRGVKTRGEDEGASGAVLTEAEKWIAGAIKKKGALHKQMGVPAGEKIPAKKLAAAAEKDGKLGKRARLAQTLSKLGK